MTYKDDGGEDDEDLALGTIFTVSRKSCLASYSFDDNSFVLIPTHGGPAGTSSSTIARTDHRSLREHHQPRG